jgi:hypothetical protein
MDSTFLSWRSWRAPGPTAKVRNRRPFDEKQITTIRSDCAGHSDQELVRRFQVGSLWRHASFEERKTEQNEAIQVNSFPFRRRRTLFDKRAHAFLSVGGRGDGAEILDRLGDAASVIAGTQERSIM